MWVLFFLPASWKNKFPRFLPCLGLDTNISYSIYSRDLALLDLRPHSNIESLPMGFQNHKQIRGAREACPQRQHIRKEKRQSLVQNSNVSLRALALLRTFRIHLHSTHHQSQSPHLLVQHTPPSSLVLAHLLPLMTLHRSASCSSYPPASYLHPWQPWLPTFPLDRTLDSPPPAAEASAIS